MCTLSTSRHHVDGAQIAVGLKDPERKRRRAGPGCCAAQIEPFRERRQKPSRRGGPLICLGCCWNGVSRRESFFSCQRFSFSQAPSAASILLFRHAIEHPLINVTDSGVEKRRAISRASLITTGLGVSEKPMNSGDSNSQYVTIDSSHAVHAPVLGIALDQLIDLRLMFGGNPKQVVGEASHLFVEVTPLVPERFPNLLQVLFAHVELKQHLQRKLA